MIFFISLNPTFFDEVVERKAVQEKIKCGTYNKEIGRKGCKGEIRETAGEGKTLPYLKGTRDNFRIHVNFMKPTFLRSLRQGEAYDKK